MKNYELKIKTKSKNYSVLIGSDLIKNISNILRKKNIEFSKCLMVIDKNVPKKFKSILKKKIKAKKKRNLPTAQCSRKSKGICAKKFIRENE